MFASTVLSRLTKSIPQPLLPISASASTPPPYTDTLPPSSSDASATLLALARQEAHLQSHIQYLLDVQSDRLIEGLSDTQPPTHHSPPPKHRNNSINHASPSSSLSSSPAAAAAAAAAPSLHTARHDLSASISALASLKASSASLLSASLAATTDSLSAVTSIQTRRSALRAKIAALEASPASRSLDELAREEEALGREIEEVEGRLLELKARRRVVRGRVQEGRNKEEARVSSWRRSLELLEGEEGDVLSGRGAAASSLGGIRAVRGKGRDSVWDLKPERRTLEMVGEYYVSEREALLGRLEDVGKEREALEEGGRVWSEVVGVVGDLEGLLEREMGSLGEGTEEERSQGIERVLHAMTQARETVQGKLTLAEEKGWKLLVVAVGAELEALVEGQAVLCGVAGVGGDGDGARARGHGDEERRGQGLRDVRELGDGVPGGRNGMVEETDDDEPGPDLLMSTQEDEVGQLRI
ncbi:MAG: hypothetical protein LQ345_005388 [Seirophora villosa]|nr:MAG: hypothetical protein LQ345_005388 [Seirophora villosa]